MSSLHDIIAWEGRANYAASRGGIILLMKSVAQEVAHLRIRVNAISPGARRRSGKPTSPEIFDSVLLKLIPCKCIGTRGRSADDYLAGVRRVGP